MYGVFIQTRIGFAWVTSEKTIEAARGVCADYRGRDYVDFAMVMRVEYIEDMETVRSETTTE